MLPSFGLWLFVCMGSVATHWHYNIFGIASRTKVLVDGIIMSTFKPKINAPKSTRARVRASRYAHAHAILYEKRDLCHSREDNPGHWAALIPIRGGTHTPMNVNNCVHVDPCAVHVHVKRSMHSITWSWHDALDLKTSHKSVKKLDDVFKGKMNGHSVEKLSPKVHKLVEEWLELDMVSRHVWGGTVEREQ